MRTARKYLDAKPSRFRTGPVASGISPVLTKPSLAPIAAGVCYAASDAAGLEVDRPIVQSAHHVKVRADQRLMNDGGAGERGHALRNDRVRAVADRRGLLRIRPGHFVSYL